MENIAYESSAEKYLNLIGTHLKEGHAALLVGAGFSRNADKIDDHIVDSPLWGDLAKAFAAKLSDSPEEQKRLQQLNPLALAERVEVMYGRPELDRLLLDSIRDSDYLPSELYHMLLSLPWTDIFTTNYDTLLERASDEITEKPFRVIAEKEDLIGSSGVTRIIKLHGSFPSHRPFIITAEDYRTYPEKFAPFVNTVQQSLLENTLCLIGFSGDDPNFQKWIGWIRDNLGRDNCPPIYMLVPRPLPEAEVKLLYRKNVIPIDLSQLAPGKSYYNIFEAALGYLLKQTQAAKADGWNLDVSFWDVQGHLISLTDATTRLKAIRQEYPGWITVPSNMLEMVRTKIVQPAREILSACCMEHTYTPLQELEYLYEYDWMREKSLLPPFTDELRCYHEILNRNTGIYSSEAISVKLSLLRDLRESGDWENWNDIKVELCKNAHLDREQLQQLQWEECLCNMAQYHFHELTNQLERWETPSSMPLWCLRRAGLLAECGKLNIAYELLCRAILHIRRRLSHQGWNSIALESLESALMELKHYIAQVDRKNRFFSGSPGESASAGNKDENVIIENQYGNHHTYEEIQLATDQPPTESLGDEIIDDQHRALHDQHHVSWNEQNVYFTSRLVSPQNPFQEHTIHATFDFGVKKGKFHLGEDKDCLLAYSFLRFREETGIPFWIGNVHHGREAACGAAARIAQYSDYWSILTIVRSDEPKAVGNAITRGILSAWPQAEVDRQVHFYTEAVLRTEKLLVPDDWFYRENFVRLSADVLPEVLSELCARCSAPCMEELLNCLEIIYNSPQRLCYQQALSLTKRLLSVYPGDKHRGLILRLLHFPVQENNSAEQQYFPNPLVFVPATQVPQKQFLDEPVFEVEKLFTDQTNMDSTVLSKLMYCLVHSLLTESQAIKLRGILWENGQFHVPKGWLSSICFRFPEPSGIDWTHYLCDYVTRCALGYLGQGKRPKNDFDLPNEINAAALSRKDAFEPEQISNILLAFSTRMESLSHNLQTKGPDFMGMQDITRTQMYMISHSLWLITQNTSSWVPTEEDKSNMSRILNICDIVQIDHYGIRSSWCRRLEIEHPQSSQLVEYLCTPNKDVSEWGYKILAIAVRYPEYNLLSECEICDGIFELSRQILWRADTRLSLALQVMAVVVEFQPNLISDSILSSLLIGLSFLAQQTKFNESDTVSDASKKGDLRARAAILAKWLNEKGFYGMHPDILKMWMAIIDSNEEFAEIRNI